MGEPRNIYCSFCGKHQHEVTVIVVQGPMAAICDECVDLCVNIVAERRAAKVANATTPTPDIIAAAIMAERERCASVVSPKGSDIDPDLAEYLAAAIRGNPSP